MSEHEHETPGLAIEEQHAQENEKIIDKEGALNETSGLKTEEENAQKEEKVNSSADSVNEPNTSAGSREISNATEKEQSHPVVEVCTSTFLTSGESAAEVTGQEDFPEESGEDEAIDKKANASTDVRNYTATGKTTVLFQVNSNNRTKTYLESLRLLF